MLLFMLENETGDTLHRRVHVFDFQSTDRQLTIRGSKTVVACITNRIYNQ